MTLTENLRYEIKIPMEGFHVYELRKWVKLHPSGFRETYPTRRVNNLYFDTIDFSDFQAHLEGDNERKKIRLRWYGRDYKFFKSNLEIKSKASNLGKKDIFNISKEMDFSKDSFFSICQKINNQSPKELALLLSFYHPVIINHYQREYYESLKSEVRLTIDYDHYSYDQRFSTRPNLFFSEPFHNFPIIEIKASKQKYIEVSDILSAFPSITNRFSKYIDSMLSVLGR